MRNLFLLIVIICSLISTGCKRDQPSAPGKDLKKDLQEIINRNLAVYQAKFPGKPVGMGLYIKESGTKSHGQNSQDIYISSGFPEAYKADVHFRGASTTKSFTAASILKLSQNNKLGLDDLITGNIPGTNQPYVPTTSEYAIPNKNKITIRLLLQHRAGVFDITNDSIPVTANAPYAGQRYVNYILSKEGEDHNFTLPELVSVVAKNQLSYFQPGTAFHYSNTGYHILATIIERVSGKRYDQFLKDEFLTPLEMYDTRFPYLGTDQAMPAPYATGWLNFQGNLIEWDEDNVSFTIADGNIITTPSDLAIWANALYATNTILSADLHAQMIKGIPTNEEHVIYGMGTELNPPDIGYGHNGARPAYMTVMRYNPDTKCSYVLFVNFLNAGSLADINAQGEGLANVMREAIQAVKASR